MKVIRRRTNVIVTHVRLSKLEWQWAGLICRRYNDFGGRHVTFSAVSLGRSMIFIGCPIAAGFE